MDDNLLQSLTATQRQRRVVLSVIRGTFAVLLVTVAVLRAAQSTAALSIEWWVPIIVAAIMFAAAIGIDVITPNKKISAISSVFLGLLAGMLATVAFGAIMDLLVATAIEEPETLAKLKPFVDVLKIMLGITFCYLGITTVIQTQDDFRLVIPYVEFAKQHRGVRPFILDSSTLIDARIVDVAATGLIQSTLVVPRFVIYELQTLADSSDRLKRARGRRGLEVIAKLQRSGLDVSIDETIIQPKGVDQMLIELGRRMPGTIVTADIGLSRVAQIQSVPVLNLNDVASALKPSLIPGEQIAVRMVKPGEQPGQAVGYLPDGTMVVVERAAGRVGDELMVLVSSSLQTSGGRLIFAKLADEPDERRAPTFPDEGSFHAEEGGSPTDGGDQFSSPQRSGDWEDAPSPSSPRSAPPSSRSPSVGVASPAQAPSSPRSAANPSAAPAARSPARPEDVESPDTDARPAGPPKLASPPQKRPPSPRNPRR